MFRSPTTTALQSRATGSPRRRAGAAEPYELVGSDPGPALEELAQLGVAREHAARDVHDAGDERALQRGVREIEVHQGVDVVRDRAPVPLVVDELRVRDRCRWAQGRRHVLTRGR